MFFDVTICKANRAAIAQICNQTDMEEAMEELASFHVIDHFTQIECDDIDMAAIAIQEKMDANNWPNREELVEVFSGGKLVAHLLIEVIADPLQYDIEREQLKSK